MHILVLVVCILVVVLFLVSQGGRRMGETARASPTEPVPLEAISAPKAADRHALAFISDGKLFYQAPGEEIRELQSPHVQSVVERMERHQQLHGWKKDTALGTSFTGAGHQAPADSVRIQATSAQFVSDDRILYVLKDDSFGGLFEYDLTLDREKRLLHKQFLALDDLRLHPDGDRLLCSQRTKNGAANIVAMDVEANSFRELTSGDTIDAAPAWIPGQADSILFQSSGLARNKAGYVVAQGPSSIQLANNTTGRLETILEDPRYDFLQPRVGGNGYLYFIRRPYEAPRYGFMSSLVDTLLFPFRLLRAIVHYFNFFSLMYSRKPLITASGPAGQADLKDILIKGKKIDAEAALRAPKMLRGVPSLVPATWQLVCRSPQGQEHVLASHVAAFDLVADGTVLFSNGYGVFALDSNKSPEVLLRDKLIVDVIVAPERTTPRTQIW